MEKFYFKSSSKKLDSYNRLLDIFLDSIEEAQSLWLSDYACSDEEIEERKRNDDDTINEFKKLLNEIIGD